MGSAILSSRPKAERNKLRPEDRPAHEWYRFVLSFPPHLVRDYLERFGLGRTHTVLDPFCGTGTTLVECKKTGIPSIGIEANPMAYLASQVKVDWKLDSCGLLRHAAKVAERTIDALEANGIHDVSHPLFQSEKCNGSPVTGRQLRTLPHELAKLLLTNSISPVPLHKVLVLRDHIWEARNEIYQQHELLALAKALVFTISNLHFGPEVGVGPPKKDAPVVSAWLAEIRIMADDLDLLQGAAVVPSTVHQADSRQVDKLLEPHSIDAVITSPPYPNEKDYTRTTRLESVLLGLIRDKAELRRLKQGLVRSNTRSVYKSDNDDQWVAKHAEIQRIAKAIEARRIELGKTSGFERLYARVTKLYFGVHRDSRAPDFGPTATVEDCGGFSFCFHG